MWRFNLFVFQVPASPSCLGPLPAFVNQICPQDLHQNHQVANLCNFSMFPPKKINMPPEKGLFQKNKSSSNHHSSGDMLAFRGYSSFPWSAGEQNFFLPKGQSTAYRVRCTTPRIAHPLSKTVWFLSLWGSVYKRSPAPVDNINIYIYCTYEYPMFSKVLRTPAGFFDFHQEVRF